MVCSVFGDLLPDAPAIPGCDPLVRIGFLVTAGRVPKDHHVLQKLIAVATSMARSWALGTSAVIKRWLRPPSGHGLRRKGHSHS